MRELTKETFKTDIAKGVVVVDMYADWCGPCRALSPILQELDGKFEGVEICKLNIDDAQDIAQEYGVMSIPCVIFFKNGKEVQRIIGLNPKQTYENIIKDLV